MTPSGRDKNIDTVLSLFDVKMEISEKDIEGAVDKSEANRTIVQMIAIGLVKSLEGLGEMTFVLSSFGVKVKQHGSWTSYLAAKADDKRLVTAQIKSSILTNNTTILILVLTAVISGLSAWISWLNYDFLQTHQKTTTEMSDSLLNRSIQQQNDILLRIDEALRTDSLKSKH